MSAVLQQKIDGKRRCTLDEVAVVCSSGEEGASWQALENAGGQDQQHTRNVRVLFLRKTESRKGYKANDNVSILPALPG